MEILFLRRARLERWERRSFWPAIAEGHRPTDRHDLYQAEVGREPAGPPVDNGPFRAAAYAIMSYRIFPGRLVSGLVRRVPVEPGDTIGIRYHLVCGMSLFFGARVVDCFDGMVGTRWRTGFSYRTLVGHPELGEETFAVEKSLEDGVVVVSLRSWSRPGTLLARIGSPLVRRLQVSASHAALDHLRRTAAEAAP